jgi:hypothetical protein
MKRHAPPRPWRDRAGGLYARLSLDPTTIGLLRRKARGEGVHGLASLRAHSQAQPLDRVHVQDGDSEKRAKALFENHPTHDISVTSDSSVTSKKSAQA